MCNGYRLSAKQVSVMRAYGSEPPYSADETYPVPCELFPTGKKTARYGLVMRRSTQGNSP